MMPLSLASRIAKDDLEHLKAALPNLFKHPDAQKCLDILWRAAPMVKRYHPDHSAMAYMEGQADAVGLIWTLATTPENLHYHQPRNHATEEKSSPEAGDSKTGGA